MDARKAWKELAPDDKLTERILSSLERDKSSQQWTTDNGLFIPYPATWLKNRRWEDEQPSPTVSASAKLPSLRRNCSFTVEDLKERKRSRYKK